VIVNTCTLTARADRDVRKFLRRITRLNPGARLVVAGCSVETGSLGSDGLAPEWMVLSNAEKDGLPRKILDRADGGVGGARADFKPLRSRALLKVQDGCDLRCTFCVIPRARGRGRSLEPKEAIARARTLTARGHREIVVCGIHLSSYGLDLRPRSSLSELVEGLTRLKGLGRIRLSSLDPRSLDDGLMDLLTGSPKVCPHFHLSLQHGSDRILRLMGRNSRVSDYSRLLVRLRSLSPDCALGADIIVGFPGETESDFEEMRRFLENSPLDYLHVFAYSPRPGTPAASWPRVGETEKRRRSAALRTLSETKRRAFRERFLGKTLGGIVIRKADGTAEVLTSNYINVRVPDCPGKPGEEVKVRVVRLEWQTTWGEAAEGQLVG
jgi:threonylcarbamoyladenosine tRNA methylthiotransferase MtaB